MVGQHSNRHGGNTPRSRHRPIRSAQFVDIFNQCRSPPISKRHREKVSPARNKIESIHDHTSHRIPCGSREKRSASRHFFIEPTRREVPSADFTGTRTRFASPGYAFSNSFIGRNGSHGPNFNSNKRESCVCVSASILRKGTKHAPAEHISQQALPPFSQWVKSAHKKFTCSTPSLNRRTPTSSNSYLAAPRNLVSRANVDEIKAAECIDQGRFAK